MATGSGIAQVFPFITSIFIARLYTPHDMGVYALYFSLCTIFTTVITLGYDNTIYLSKSERLSNNSLLLCVLITLILSFFLTVLLVSLPTNIFNFLGIKSVKRYSLYIFLSIITATVSALLTNRINREGKFKFLSKMKVFFSILSTLIQLFFGVLGIGTLGLIFANITAYLVADTVFIFYILKSNFFHIEHIKLRYMLHIFKKYKKFAIYMGPSAIISSLSNEIPNFMLSCFFGEKVVGFYSFGQKIIVYPINFIISSIQEVFRNEAANEYLSLGHCKSVYMKTVKILIPFTIISIVLFSIFTPLFFKVLFGTKWIESGIYIQITCVFFIIRAMSSILSFSIILAEKQKINLFFLIVLMVATYLSFYIGHIFFSTPIPTLILNTIVNVILYAYYIKMSYSASRFK
ncbi:MAG: oligosaccharide flippase family protein [Bacteroidetes bacterium]|nr:oligosaccharide flippase family protein [Bacteroidota bacterium]